jgi:hypothetical protein
MVVGNLMEDLVTIDAIPPLLLPAHVSTCRSSTGGAGWESWVEVGVRYGWGKGNGRGGSGLAWEERINKGGVM